MTNDRAPTTVQQKTGPPVHYPSAAAIAAKHAEHPPGARP